MTVKLQIYKCEICGNLVQVLQEGEGNLICCGEEMQLMGVQYDTNELGEKHTPKKELKNGKNFINVFGHPMTKEHFIQFIETFTPDKKEIHIKFFSPEEQPETEAKIDGEFSAVEYCNIHGLWGENKISENTNNEYTI